MAQRWPMPTMIMVLRSVVAATLLFFVTTPAYSQANNNAASTNNTSTTDLAVNSGANVNQPSVSISRIPRQAPGAIAPGMAVSAVETCLGSMTFGASTILGGVSVGIPMEDKQCTNRLNARMLSQLGQATAALVLLCQGRDDITRALAAAGLFCPTIEASEKKLSDHRQTEYMGEIAKYINEQSKQQIEEQAKEAAQEQDTRTDSEKIEDLFYDSQGNAFKAQQFPSDKHARSAGAIKSDSGEWVVPVFTSRGGR